MNCRPCLYVFLVTGGFFLIGGLIIFALGVLKLVIRVKRPNDGKSEADWQMTKPANAGDVFSLLLNQNAIFVLICGLLSILLSVILLFPGWLCLRRSDRLKRRRQAKGDAEAAHIEGEMHGTKVNVPVDTHEGAEARATDPLLAGAAVTSVEIGVNGIPRAAPEEEDDEESERRPLTEKEQLEQRLQQRESVGSDGHVVYDRTDESDPSCHQNPVYHLREEEKHRQHAGPTVTTHSAQQHHYGDPESTAFQGYPSDDASCGLGPVAPVPALAVHRVVEEEDDVEVEGMAGGADGNQEAGDAEDPPFANEGYVYASVKRTDRHSRSPSDESASKPPESSEAGAPHDDTTSPRSSYPPVAEEGRSALLQKAHDLVDEVLRVASDSSNSHSLRMTSEYAMAQEDPYETCDSPIPSVHEEDEIPHEDAEAEAEEEADHRSVTSSEEGDACFNAPTPELPHTANAAIIEESEEEEEEEEEEEREAPAELSGNHVESERASSQIDQHGAAPDIMPPVCDRHSDDEQNAEEEEDEDERVEEEEEEEERQPTNGGAAYEFEDIPQYGISEIPPPPPIESVPEEEEDEDEGNNEIEDPVSDPNANVTDQIMQDAPQAPPNQLDFMFGAGMGGMEHEEKSPEEEEAEEEGSDHEAAPEEDVNANKAAARLVHISPEDDVEISELLGPQVLRSSQGEEGEAELPPPSSSPSPPPPPPPPALPEAEAIIDFGEAEKHEETEGDLHQPAGDVLPAPEHSLLADLGIYEEESAEEKQQQQPPPPASHEAFDNLVNFDDPSESSATPPPPPPPPPPAMEEDTGEGWHTQY